MKLSNLLKEAFHYTNSLDHSKFLAHSWAYSKLSEDNKVCLTCLAGGYLAGKYNIHAFRPTLKSFIIRGHLVFPLFTSKEILKERDAIDYAREGLIVSALKSLNVEAPYSDERLAIQAYGNSVEKSDYTNWYEYDVFAESFKPVIEALEYHNL